MNTSQVYHWRRRDAYPDTSGNYSSRPPSHYRAASVDLYHTADDKPKTYEVISSPYSRDYSSRPPPIPQHQPTYRGIPFIQPYHSTPSTSTNRCRISGALPRSNSMSRLLYPDSSAPSSHYSTHYPTATSYNNQTNHSTYDNNNRYVYRPTSSSSSYRHEPLTTSKRLDSQLSESFTRLSTRSPTIYNGTANNGIYAFVRSSAEIRPRRQRQKEMEEVSNEGAFIKPKPRSRNRGLDSPDSTNLPNYLGQGRRGSSSNFEGNVNNMYSLRASTSSSSSGGEYSGTSPGPRLHGGHSSFNSALSSTSRSNTSGNAGLIGLVNLGNTCFMNSVLQCLSNTSELRLICLNDVYTSEINVNSTMKGNLFKAYTELMRQMWPSTGTSVGYISPQRFRSQIQRFAPRFVGNSQQDAQEFLRYLVQGLHEDVNRVTHRPPTEPPDYDKEDKMPVIKKAELYWQRYKLIDDSLISDLFMGQLMSTLECLKCGHQSTTFDPFWDLSLPIPPMNKVDIEDCFNHFTSNEILGGSEQPTCSGCKLRQPCRKRFSIQRFPKILVIHFKRFSGDRSGSKISTFIDYPIEDLDLTQYASHCSSEMNARYQLYAVSNHIGDVFLGHYTACCRHPMLKSWYLFNDQIVKQIDPRDAVSAQAYVLFYHRIH
ncbi:unnamed protein product [Hymenolepis diminuta]|uniref:Ubiquitin carboxyl-terminal hydrolase n=1 Tax=Hymenolepis diminuta TaxID=6216 RepID=A0A564Y0K6_HYMDI|nr:unnamed protein product [Hymenolepis diminuta]